MTTKKKQRKKYSSVTAQVAKAMGFSSRYVQQVMGGQRNNEDVKAMYKFIEQQQRKILQLASKRMLRKAS